MRNERRSILLLIVLIFLGLNILTEFSFSSTDPSNVSVSLESGNISTGAVGGDCADPCHVGRCHFGHCAIQSQKKITVHIFEFDSTYNSQQKRVPQSPFLEGLRRPPRLS